MAFKDILVQVDDSSQCTNRIAVAVQLAQKCRAHLTGLYVIGHPHYTPQNEGRQRKAAEAEQLFRDQTAMAGLNASWLLADWGTVGGSVVEVFNYYAHTRDLVVIGQAEPGGQGGDLPEDLPQQVIAGSGRPVLVVPYAGSFDSVGRRVLVAWKAGRESARAVHDAMPFLLAADQVKVVAIDSRLNGETAGVLALAPICAHLKRHAVRYTEEALVTAKVPVAALLMEYAWENGCDLVVMGVPRAGNKLGPVARQVLDRMTVPVLTAY